MSDWNLPWSGGCRCGAVRIAVTKPPMLALACHCTGCQRMTGSAFSLSLTLPTAGFRVTEGEPVLGGLAAAGSPEAMGEHMFCPVCRTWMFTRIPGMDWFMNIRATTLDDHGWFVPFVETFRAEGLPWATTPAKHSFPGWPSMLDYSTLAMAYAAQGVRPGRAAA